ncbi:diguanylate cyclase [Neiella marina]|uniref:Diguanylate cyclase n=1 Tax=Neiella holothuriorum TaxID=2870530 RepID=A0ABS7ECU8_9GAMM|nr:diguanylate cyclase [Neiella holothuriorum]MBW8190080.1 diguanylate cyclase [Neiella holothuriorum]
MASLNALINRHFRKLFLIPVLTLELALLAMYFIVNGLITDESRQDLLFERSQNVYEHLAMRAQDLNNRFYEVRRSLELIQTDQQQTFSNPAQHQYLPNGPAQFDYASNGVWSKQHDNGGASVFVSKQFASNPETQQKAAMTESFDKLFAAVVNQLELVDAAYFNSYDNINRYYPFIDDVHLQFAADMHIPNYNFYYLADYQHNPEQQVVWTPAYLDPAGQGWMVSAIAPIYNGELLEGVTGLDITLNKMIQQIEQLALPFSGESFLVDENGRIIAMSAGIQQLLNLRELTSHAYDDVVTQTHEKPDEYLISQLPYSAFRNSISEMLKLNNYTSYVDHNDEIYLIASQSIVETGWRLYSITNAEQVVMRINELDALAIELGVIAIGLMIIFYVLFYLLVQHRSGLLAQRISSPIQELQQSSYQASPGQPFVAPTRSGIVELDDLGNSIGAMVNILNEQARNISRNEQELSSEQSHRLRLEQQIGTDELTHMLNRRGLLTQGEKILQQAKDHKQPLSLIQFEIGQYPQLIERHGIQKAEQLILQCANCCQALLPEQAILAYAATAQFTILLPKTEFDIALNHARRLRSELYLSIEIDGSSASVATHFAATTASLESHESLLSILANVQQLLEQSRHRPQTAIQTELN